MMSFTTTKIISPIKSSDYKENKYLVKVIKQ